MKVKLRQSMLFITILALLWQQGGWCYFDAGYYLRPLSRLEKGIPGFTDKPNPNPTNQVTLQYYGIERGGTTMLPRIHLATRIADAQADIDRVLEGPRGIQHEVLAAFKRHLVEIPVHRLPLELGEILAQIRLLTLLYPDREISAYGYLMQHCTSVTLVPYIIQTDKAGKITQPGCVAKNGVMYLAMGELSTREGTLVENMDQVSLRCVVAPVAIKTNGVYSLIRTTARLEAAKLAEITPSAETNWQERAAAAVLHNSLTSMEEVLTRLGVEKPNNIKPFIAARRIMLQGRMAGLNETLGLQSGDFGIVNLGVMTPPSLPLANSTNPLTDLAAGI